MKLLAPYPNDGWVCCTRASHFVQFSLHLRLSSMIIICSFWPKYINVFEKNISGFFFFYSYMRGTFIIFVYLSYMYSNKSFDWILFVFARFFSCRSMYKYIFSGRHLRLFFCLNAIIWLVSFFSGAFVLYSILRLRSLRSIFFLFSIRNKFHMILLNCMEYGLWRWHKNRT